MQADPGKLGLVQSRLIDKKGRQSKPSLVSATQESASQMSLRPLRVCLSSQSTSLPVHSLLASRLPQLHQQCPVHKAKRAEDDLEPCITGGGESVVRAFNDALSRAPDMAVAVAAIKALTEVVKSSQAHTMMGLEKDLKDAADSLIRLASSRLCQSCSLLHYTLDPVCVACKSLQDSLLHNSPVHC